MKRFLFLILGIIFLAAGCIGLVLPVIPQVPFFILAAFCFGKFSARFDEWFKNTQLYTKISAHIHKSVKKDKNTQDNAEQVREDECDGVYGDN